jgi:FKBP12-rapamycin complex-associated protein
MFPWGISEALFHALVVIASHIPPLLPTIQSESCPSKQADILERLLDSISVVLVGSPFRPLGAPPPRGGPNPAQVRFLR